MNTTDHNLVILAAARNNEVTWDTSKGGALTYNFSQCLGGTATDTDHSGSLSELRHSSLPLIAAAL